MLDSIIESLLIFLVVFSPLIHGSVTILPLSIVEGISFLLLFIFFVKQIKEGKIALVKIPFLPLLLFLGLTVFQLIPLPMSLLSFISPATAALYREFKIDTKSAATISIYPELTVDMFLQSLSFLSVFLVALNYMDSEEKIRRIIRIIIACGIFYAFYGITRLLDTFYMGVISTFTNRDHFAAYLEMIIPLAISYSLIENSRFRRTIFLFLGAIMVIALFLTWSRAGRICFLLSTMTMVSLLAARRRSRKTITVLLGLFLIISILIIVIGPALSMNRMDTLLEGYLGRLNINRDTLKIIRDFPFFGTGLWTFSEIFPKYKTFISSSIYNFAHNEPFQLAAETGIPAFMFISFFFLAIMKIILSLWHKRNSAFSVFATLGCLIGIVSIILHSFFDFVFHIPANAYLFFMLLPLALRSVYLKKEQSLLPVPRIGINFSGVFIPCAILLSLFLLCFIEVSISRRYLAKAIYQEVAESKPPGSGLDDLLRYTKLIKKIEHAASLNPLSAKYISKKGDILLEVANRRDFEPQLQYFGELQNRMAILGEAETCYRKAIDIDPAKADYHLQLGWIYSLLGKTELMHSQFKKAILLDKKNTKLKSYIEDYTKALGFLENKIF